MIRALIILAVLVFGIGSTQAEYIAVTPAGGGSFSSICSATSSGQLVYNNAGTCGGITGWTTNGTTAITGGAGTTLAVGNTTIGSNTFTAGTSQIISGSFGLAGNISSAAWTTSGVRYKNVAATLTDTTSSGTVAAAYSDVFGGSTIAASSATTFTDYATMFVNVPTAGSNVTITNIWSLITAGNIKAPALTLAPAANVTSLTLTGGSITGASTTSPGISVASTLNTSGKIDGAVLNAAVTVTAAGGGSSFINLLGGSGGSTLKFNVDLNGTITLGGGAGIANGSNAAGATFDINKINNGIVTSSNYVWAWSNSTSNISTLDTGLSRISAGIVGVGTGAAGNISGTVSAQAYIASGNSGVDCAAGTISIVTAIVTKGIVTHC